MRLRLLKATVALSLVGSSWFISSWLLGPARTGVPFAALRPGDRVVAAGRGGEPAATAAAGPGPGRGNGTLPPCPAEPPHLVGPLRVEFDWKRTMEDVRSESGRGLRTGGQYEPHDCVSEHKVAIVIPFRNRHEHLKHWLFYLHPILKRQQISYGIYVINQHGDGAFNRAKLLNVGFVEALKEFGYGCFVFSDVDLVPLNDRNLYRCYGEPRHLAVAMDKFGFDLPYKNYFGGVVSFSKDHYMKINGFSNSFWGWGAEDDDMLARINFRKMAVSRPDLQTGRYKMIRHGRDVHNEPNPHNPDKLHQTQWTMEKDGINTLTYTVKKVAKDPLYTFITVDIQSPR